MLMPNKHGMPQDDALTRTVGDPQPAPLALLFPVRDLHFTRLIVGCKSLQPSCCDGRAASIALGFGLKAVHVHQQGY